MSLLYRSAVAATGNFIKPATNGHGGENLDINALEIAKGLWQESRLKTFPTAA